MEQRLFHATAFISNALNIQVPIAAKWRQGDVMVELAGVNYPGTVALRRSSNALSIRVPDVRKSLCAAFDVRRPGTVALIIRSARSDLSSRRGRILGTDVDRQFQIVRADVPAMELYRYASVLRSLTGGRGVHSEQFSRYEEMPREIEQRVIEEAKKARADNSSPAR